MITRLKFRTKKAKQRERIKLLTRLSVGLVAVLSFVGLIAYGSHLEGLRIKTVHVETDGVLSTDELTQALTEELAGDYLGVWPKDFVATVQTANLSTVLTERFPRVGSAQMRRTGLYTLTAKIEEREPAALWCGDIIPPIAYEETSDEVRNSEELWGTCYLLDQGGYIYARAPIFSGNIFPRYYGSLEHGEPIAQQYLPIDEFRQWQELYLTLEKNGIVPQALLFVDERDIELYLTNGLRILIARDSDTNVVERRLLAVLESDVITRRTEVEYIDLRFGKKAFVKYFSQEETTLE